MTAAKQQTPFPDRMRDARNNAGMSLERAARRLEVDFGISLRGETIRKYETGYYNEDNADPVVVMALADIYRVKPAALSPAIVKRAKRLRDLLIRTSPWITDPSAHTVAA